MRHPVRLFANPVLERMTRARPMTVVLIWGTVIGALLGWALGDRASTPGMAMAAFFGGMAFWTLFEYGMHRYAFHWQPRRPALVRLVFLMHGCHHADPEDPERAVMPPAASVPLSLFMYGLFSLALSGPALSLAFAGFLAGYLAYDVIHWACHQTRPRTRLGRALRRHHLRHHYHGVDGNYGVSSPLWDRVFGTVLGAEVRPS